MTDYGARFARTAEDRAALALAVQQGARDPRAKVQPETARRARPQPTPIPASRAGLSRGYRFMWRLNYTLLAWGGPAQRSLSSEPREKMRRERAERVARAQRAAA